MMMFIIQILMLFDFIGLNEISKELLKKKKGGMNGIVICLAQ